MKRYPKLVAFLICLLATSLSFAAGVAATVAVGKATNSGLVGICGPYGPAADILGWMLLASIVVSLHGSVLVLLSQA